MASSSVSARARTKANANVRLTFELRNHEAVIATLDGATNRIRVEVESAVFWSGKELIREVRRDMAQPKHGYHYRWLPVRSSAPGESPAMQSHKLERSIVSILSITNGMAVARVGPTVGYARYLEDGGPWVEPRPAFRPALEVVAEKFKKRVLGVLGRELL